MGAILRLLEAAAARAGSGLPLVQERAWEWTWHPMWGWGIWGIGMMLLSMLLFWAMVIVGVVLGFRWLFLQGKGGRADAALDILRQRYARGEINKEEFEAKKRDLA